MRLKTWFENALKLENLKCLVFFRIVFSFQKIWAKQDTMKAPRVGREARDLPAILLDKNKYIFR